MAFFFHARQKGSGEVIGPVYEATG